MSGVRHQRRACIAQPLREHDLAVVMPLGRRHTFAEEWRPFTFGFNGAALI
jgi:hypothetical protein